MLSEEQTCPERSRRKQQLRQAKKEKIIRIRKTLSEMSEEQRQAIANKFGIVTVEGHLLTPHNQCFLVAQSEINFSIVGGFKQWKNADRIVRKCEYGFLIFVPSKFKKEENSEMISDDEDVKFFNATVFDISQTAFIEKLEVA